MDENEVDLIKLIDLHETRGNNNESDNNEKVLQQTVVQSRRCLRRRRLCLSSFATLRRGLSSRFVVHNRKTGIN